MWVVIVATAYIKQASMYRSWFKMHSCGLHHRWYPIPYIVHYFWPKPIKRSALHRDTAMSLQMGFPRGVSYFSSDWEGWELSSSPQAFKLNSSLLSDMKYTSTPLSVGLTAYLTPGFSNRQKMLFYSDKNIFFSTHTHTSEEVRFSHCLWGSLVQSLSLRKSDSVTVSEEVWFSHCLWGSLIQSLSLRKSDSVTVYEEVWFSLIVCVFCQTVRLHRKCKLHVILET
jgi:hypothetical protein